MRPFILICTVTALLLTSLSIPGPARAAAPAGESLAPSTQSWLEPNGLSVMDLVGYVPDSYLANAPIFNATGFGLMQYESGSRSGSTVRFRARVYPVRLGTWSQFGCPAQPPQGDQWGTVMPAGRVRVYVSGNDITSQVGLHEYEQAGQVLPVRGTNTGSDYSRYAATVPGQPLPISGGWGILPANRGCKLLIPGTPSVVTADFEFDVVPRVIVFVLGQQQVPFHTYIGVGGAGWLGGLQNQMRSAFGDRHEYANLNVPAGSPDYVFVNFPLESFDLYLGYPDYPSLRDQNLGLPTSGTYRLKGDRLSSDHVVSMGLPLRGQWGDADQSGGAPYLPYIVNPRVLTVPEYFLPSGMGYNPCMTSGTCSGDLLNQIHNATMYLTVTYLKVERIAGGLTRVPLQQVGPSWTPGAAARNADFAAARPAIPSGLDKFYYLPVIQVHRPPPLPPDDPTGCPCGWFDDNGRMLDFIPAP